MYNVYLELTRAFGCVFSFCVVPEPSDPSNTASSSVLVAWYSTALVQLVAPI